MTDTSDDPSVTGKTEPHTHGFGTIGPALLRRHLEQVHHVQLAGATEIELQALHDREHVEQPSFTQLLRSPGPHTHVYDGNGDCHICGVKQPLTSTGGWVEPPEVHGWNEDAPKTNDLGWPKGDEADLRAMLDRFPPGEWFTTSNSADEDNPWWIFAFDKWDDEDDSKTYPIGAVHCERGEFTAESDLAEFIVAARNAIPSLIAERDAALARIAAVEALTEQWDELLLTCSAIMTTAQRNAWKDALAELRAVLAASPTPTTETIAPEDALGLNDDAKQIIAELRDLWQRALEREGNLASAVADTVWKATQYGETEDGDTFAYIVPKGTMHRLVGVAQSNGAHVPVAFRAASPTPTDPERCPECNHEPGCRCPETPTPHGCRTCLATPTGPEPATTDHDWDFYQPATTCRRCGSEYHSARWVNCPSPGVAGPEPTEETP